MKTRICDITAAVLRETENPAVMWGDSGLLDQIVARAGSTPKRPIRLAGGGEVADLPAAGWKRILDALTRQPGELIPGHTEQPDGRIALRIFWLPEHAPPWALKNWLDRKRSRT